MRCSSWKTVQACLLCIARAHLSQASTHPAHQANGSTGRAAVQKHARILCRNMPNMKTNMQNKQHTVLHITAYFVCILEHIVLHTVHFMHIVLWIICKIRTFLYYYAYYFTYYSILFCMLQRIALYIVYILHIEICMICKIGTFHYSLK